MGILHAADVRRYCEIGARHGDTFHEVMLSLPLGSVGVAVDLPGGLWGRSSSRPSLEAAVADLRGRGYRASVLFGDSQSMATQRMLRSRGPFDAILIDGDHTLEGVTRDWELYGDMAEIVAFHDIVGSGQAEKVSGREVEVPVLWEQLREEHRNLEIVDDGSQMGIGVLWTA